MLRYHHLNEIIKLLFERHIHSSGVYFADKHCFSPAIFRKLNNAWPVFRVRQIYDRLDSRI